MKRCNSVSGLSSGDSYRADEEDKGAKYKGKKSEGLSSPLIWAANRQLQPHLGWVFPQLQSDINSSSHVCSGTGLLIVPDPVTLITSLT